MESNEPIKVEILPTVDLRTSVTPAEIAKKIRDQALEGFVDPAKVGIMVKRLAKVVEILGEDKVFKNCVKDATEKYLPSGTKTAELFGAKVSIAATYTWYDFSDCGHPVLDSLYAIEKIVKERIKTIEEELKLLIPKGGGEITPNTEAQGVPLDLGIKSDSKPIIVMETPQLTWIPDGSAYEVKAPRKKQQFGVKYLKV